MTSVDPSDRLLHALVGLCGPHAARLAGPGDTVAGRRARFVAAPATSTSVGAVLRLAANNDLAVVVRGAGTKLDWCAPPPAVDLLLDTRRLTGVWHHRPDQLTAEVGAGTTVRALQAALALRGQRLAMDPPSPGATVGGVLAVNESGPLRHRFGTPHQQVSEIQVVDPAGAASRSTGGDAVRAAGDPSPEVLVSAAVRLQSLPEARCWVSVPVSTPSQMRRVVADTLHADATLSAVEVDLPGAELPGAGPGRQGGGTVAALIEGDAGGVRKRSDGLAAALGGTALAFGDRPAWWGRYPFGRGEVALRLTVAADDLPAIVYALGDAVGAPVPVRGSAGVGVVHAALPGRLGAQRVEQILEAVRGVLMGRGGHCVVVSAPPSISTEIDMADRTDLR